MPVVCVWIPSFRLAVARLTQPQVDLDAPLILADKVERGRVVDCTLTAAALGVRPGITLVQAQAVAHEARTIFDDPVADARVWAEILEALDASSPIVEDAGLGRAFLEMHGIAGDAAAWIGAVQIALRQAQGDNSAAQGDNNVTRDLRDNNVTLSLSKGDLRDNNVTLSLSKGDLPVRVACGANRFVAHAAAWRGDGVVCDGDPSAFLAPLPLELLAQEGLDDGVRERLRLLGVTTLGELAALPHGPFVRRFGAEAARWHDRARGIDDRPLRPRPRALRVDRTLYGEGEASSEEQVLFALRTLVGLVVDDLSAAGKRAGRLALFLECEDGETREVAVRVAQPTAVPATLFELLRARLEGVTLTAPVVGLRLAAEELASGGVALSLFAASDPDPDAIGVVLARLDAALGEGNALRARVVDGPRIERRYVLEPFTIEPLVTRPALRQAQDDRLSQAQDDRLSQAQDDRRLSARATLQLRIVEPRPVEVRILGGVPRFVGSPPQQVVEVAGPWRVEERWWGPATGEGTPLARDEYDVCLDDGALLRIVREGDAWSVRGVYD